MSNFALGAECFSYEYIQESRVNTVKRVKIIVI